MTDKDEISIVMKSLTAEERREIMYDLLEEEEIFVPNDDRERIISLTHDHLPRLGEYQIIEYLHDSTGISIRRGEKFGRVRKMLEFVRDEMEE